ncbi:lactonase family protein [Sabulilitoribacter multivorans]|uniref:Lactonase family protein n=1 Tax=Flaviramulus multivorans TaxID=1304750 RepID=A0ABS9ILS7_9FLAO|nr:lactonase family protein [Flaviramulus multivorans]MCF7561518.1 lactonase family protein [Flaviramulus multivorans]
MVRSIQKYLFWFLTLIFSLGFFLSCTKQGSKTLLFVGSFTDKKLGEGIRVYDFNSQTGEAQLKFTFDSIINTSFLKLSPKSKYLYSVVDSQMEYHGKIAAFEVDSVNYKLKFLNVQDSGGRNPAHLEIDKTGEFLVNSNYSDPSLSVFKINKNGSLNSYNQVIRFKDSSIIESRQESAHIHSSNFSPDGRFLFAQDLGSDKIRSFRFNRNQKDSILKNKNKIKVKSGSGPRHFTFHPNGKLGYGIAELNGKITAYAYSNGSLTFIEDYQSYELKQDIYRAADIHISPDGKFLYTSNRGPEEDSIAIFSINEVNGKLSLVGYEPTYGKHPRNFAISGDGNFIFVANQFSNNITIFKREIKTGKLIKLPKEILVNQPASIQIATYKDE